MATYVNDLRLKEIATGDSAGTWGTETNVNLELIAEAMGHGTEAIANASTHTITMADGVSDGFRCTFLRLTGGGQACTVTLAPNTLSHTWVMRNETSYTLTLTQGSGANVNISSGQTKIVSTNGGGSGAIVYEMDDLELAGNLVVGGTLGVTGVLTGTSLDISGDIDVDGTTNLDVVDIDGAVNMATTALVTGVLTTTATQVATGGITSGSDIISDTDSTDSLGSTGVRWLKGWFDTLTAGTLTIGSGSVTDSSGAISFGNENLTTTGIVTAAGTSVFTNLDISGDIDVDGTTNLDVVDIDGAVNMATTALVTGVLTTTAATVFNGGFASNAASTITTADNLDTLSLISTDADANAGPNLNMFRNSASPADGDAVGLIEFEGKNDAGTTVRYAGIDTRIADASNGTEDGRMELLTTLAGSGGISRLYMDATETVINDNSKDLDFRVESDGKANMLFVDGGENRVGVGTGSPSVRLEVGDGVSSEAIKVNAGSGWADLRLNSGSSNGGSIYWNDGADAGQLFYYHVDDSMRFHTATTERLRIASGGGITTYPAAGGHAVFNESGIDADFRVESDGNDHMLFVDGGNNRVGVGTSDRLTAPLTIQSAAGADGISIIGRNNGAADEALISFYEYDGTTRNAYIVKEAGELAIATGTGGSPTEKLRIGASGVIVNETGIDADFRVESDGNDHMLFVDGGNNRVGIGTGSPRATLQISSGSGTHALGGGFARGTSNAVVDILTVSGQSANCGVAIYARLVVAGAVGNEAAVIEFWAALNRQLGGSDTATAVAPVVSKAIVGTAIGAGSLAWSGKTLQYTPACTTNYVGFQMEIQIATQDPATITILP